MIAVPAEGGCECGAIRYRLTAPPAFVNACHCRLCQRMSGSAFAINVMIAADAVVLTAGAPVPDDWGMIRCPACLTALWATHPKIGPETLFVRAGTLDASERIVPDAHFFVRSKHPWIVLPDGVPAYQTLPEAAEVAPVVALAAGKPQG